uniref:Low-temperature inducible n=1 Tax=Rheum australe TaxID=284363 RepID=B5M1Z4_RHEAU|nr:low-temperature inducible [Rheum australe]
MDEEYSRPSGDHQRPAHHGHHEPASNTELMESAKMMAAAVQSAVGGKTSSIDKARVAGAAENLLGAAQRYGKLDETSGIGKYVDKAEDYLHKYHSSGSQHTGAGTEGEDYAPVSDHGRHRREEDKEEDYADPVSDHRRAPVSDHGHHRREEEEESGSGGGSGVGEYINMAKGFFK